MLKVNDFANTINQAVTERFCLLVYHCIFVTVISNFVTSFVKILFGKARYKSIQVLAFAFRLVAVIHDFLSVLHLCFDLFSQCLIVWENFLLNFLQIEGIFTLNVAIKSFVVQIISFDLFTMLMNLIHLRDQSLLKRRLSIRIPFDEIFGEHVLLLFFVFLDFLDLIVLLILILAIVIDFLLSWLLVFG